MSTSNYVSVKSLGNSVAVYLNPGWDSWKIHFLGASCQASVRSGEEVEHFTLYPHGEGDVSHAVAFAVHSSSCHENRRQYCTAGIFRLRKRGDDWFLELKEPFISDRVPQCRYAGSTPVLSVDVVFPSVNTVVTYATAPMNIDLGHKIFVVQDGNLLCKWASGIINDPSVLEAATRTIPPST